MSAHMPGPWKLDEPQHAELVDAGYHFIDAGRGFYEPDGGFGIAGCMSLANARLIAAAPDLLAEVEREYAELSNVHNSWPGRDTPSGQMKLGRLRDLIAKATGRSEQDVQDDYGNRGIR